VQKSIVEQDEQHLLERVSISHDGGLHGVIAPHGPAGRQKLDLTVDVVDYWFELDGFASQRSPRVGACEHEELVDEADEPLDLVLRIRQDIGAFSVIQRRHTPQQFDVAAHCRERGPHGGGMQGILYELHSGG
jgi:hypothetical protein